MDDRQDSSSRLEEAGEQGGEEAEGEGQTRAGATNHAQHALLEMWMGLPRYGMARGRATDGEEATAALSRLRKALGAAEGSPSSLLERGSAEDGTEVIAPASTLEVRETEAFSPNRGGYVSR